MKQGQPIIHQTSHAKDMNLLEGSLLGKVFLFSLPLMATNLLQVFYNAADMIIAGMSGVDGAIGSIGTTAAMINLILNVFMGFAIGTNVVVARYIGRGDREKVEKAVHTSLVMAAIFGTLTAILGQAICRPALRLLGDQGHILDLATLYTRIYFAGAPFMAVANYQIAIFRAKGDTRTPLFVLTGTGLLNVLMNLFFVLVMKMSVDGVALATVLSNAVSMIILGIVLMRDEGMCKLSLKKLTMDRFSFREIFKNGLPAGIQGGLFSLSNMIIQSAIIGINNTVCPGGSDIIDGNAAGSSLESFAYTATNSVYQAAVTFTSQHYGAGKIKRIGSVMRNCYLVTTIIAVVVSAILIGFRYPLISMYVSGEQAVSTAITRLYVMCSMYFLLAWMEVGSGVLRGLGRSFTSTIITLAGTCVFRILWIWLFVPLFPNLVTIYLSYPISWGMTGAMHLIFSLKICKDELRKQVAKQDTEVYN